MSEKNHSDASHDKRQPTLVGVLTRKLFLSLVAVFIGIAVLINLYGGYLLRSVTNEKLEYILSSQSDDISKLLWDLDTDAIQSTLVNITKDQSIKAARVTEIDNGNESVTAEYEWDNNEADPIILTHKITYKYADGHIRDLGVLSIIADYHTVEVQLQKILVITAFLFGFTFILIATLVYRTLRKGIAPLEKLSASLVDVDYFTHKIERDSEVTREIHNLFNALIKMQSIMQSQTLEIQQQKTMLDTIIENIPIGLLVEDVLHNDDLVLMNNMMKTIFNIPENRHKNISSFFSDKDTLFLRKMNRRILENKKHIDVETYQSTSVKDELIIQIIKTPIFNNNNEISLIVSMFENVTERTKFKENLMIAKENAESANRAKSEFLANMSHELRTPMNSILGLSRIILEDTSIDNEQSEMLQTILKSSEVLLNTVNDILDLSKIESGSVNLETIPFSLKESAGAAISTIKPLADSKSRLSFTSSWHGELTPKVLGDPTRLIRIITNLCSNAVKFTDRGFVEVIYEANRIEDGKILFNICVKDSGIGIAPNKLGRIFEKFSQADDSTTRRFGGTGLGLAITKQLVEMMGGTISVTSKFGFGSEFNVSIPFTEVVETVSDEDLSASGHIDHHDLVDGKDRKNIRDIKVLIAEDQQMNQLLIKKIMEKLNVQNFDIADDGQIAFDKFRRGSYDFIIMDCHMPNMDGFQTTRAIRQLEREDNLTPVPILAMTADAMVGTREECLKAGVTDYISKPVDFQLLKKIISAWFIV